MVMAEESVEKVKKSCVHSSFLIERSRNNVQMKNKYDNKKKGEKTSIITGGTE